MKKKKRASITLIEIMIVIVLIGLITGALAFNMSGSMDRGRAFKTEQNIARIKDILLLEYASSDESLPDLTARWQDVVKHSPLVLNQGSDILKDGWKGDFTVSHSNGEIIITSKKLGEYKGTYDQKKKKA